MLRELNCCQSAERIDNTEQCLLRGFSFEVLLKNNSEIF